MKEGNGSTVLLSGEFGLGKSKLIHRLKVQLEIEEKDFTSFIFSCRKQSLLSLCSNLDLGNHGTKKSEITVSPLFKNKPELFENISSALHKVLKVETSKKAMILVDDLDSADEMTAEFWRYFSFSIEKLPILLIFTTQNPEEFDHLIYPADEKSSVLKIFLEPLKLRETALLLNSIIGQAPRINELTEWIQKKTAGNPFFILEIISSLMEKRILKPEAKYWKLAVRDLEDINLPQQMKDIFISRLDTLEPAEKEVLLMGAVVGEEFDTDILEAVTSLERIEIEKVLWKLFKSGFLGKHERNSRILFRFENSFTRENIENNLNPKELSDLHQQIGEIFKTRLLRENVAEEKDFLTLSVAEHLLLGNRKETALPYYLEGARILSSYHDEKKALQFLETAWSLMPKSSEPDQTGPDGLEDSERMQTLFDIIDKLIILGEHNKAIRKVDDAKKLGVLSISQEVRLGCKLGRLLVSTGERAKALRESDKCTELLATLPENEMISLSGKHGMDLAWIYFATGSLDKALSYCLKILSLLEDIDDFKGMLRIYHMLSIIHWQKAEYSKAGKYCLKARKIAEDSGDLSRLADSYGQLGLIHQSQGELQKALSAYQKALELFRSLKTIEKQIHAQYNIALLSDEMGRAEKARENYLAALDLAERMDYWSYIIHINAGLGTLYYAGYNWEAAKKHYQASINLARRKNHLEEMVIPLNNLASLFIRTGNLSSAMDALRESIAHCKASERNSDRGLIHLNFCAYYISTGDLDRALDECINGRKYLEKAGNKRGIAKACLLSGQIYASRLELGKLAHVLNQGKKMETSGYFNENSFLHGSFDFLAAKLHASKGKHDEALEYYTKALDLFRRREEAYHLARCLLDAGAWEIGLAEAENFDMELVRRAFNHLRESLAIFSDLDAKPDISRTQEKLARISEIAVFNVTPAGDGYLENFYKISGLIASSTNREKLLEEILRISIELLNAERGILFLKNESDDRLFVASSYMVDESSVSDAERISENILATVTSSGEPLVCDDALDNPDFREYNSIHFNKILSLLCVPLKSYDRTLGALYLDSRATRNLFSPGDREFLKTLAILLGALLENSEIYATLQKKNQELHSEIFNRLGLENIIGNSIVMEGTFDLIRKASNSDSTILLQGETGTGKELFAQAIHYRSSRALEKFVTVDCGSLPENLLESELFGHRRGAFTGAIADKVGLFEEAHNGTIFLDEIGEAPPSVQTGLLRVIEKGEIRRIGEVQYRKVDVRIISATNRDLAKEVENDQFRSDLYYRSGGLVVHLPPLRERGEDVILLSEHFLKKHSRKMKKRATGFSMETLNLFRSYSWPGNVRELENCRERALIVTEGSIIDMDAIDDRIKNYYTTQLSLKGSREAAQAKQIVEILRENKGKIVKSALVLGISERHLRRLVKKYEITIKN